jgi:hypothetical protein
MMNPVKPRDSTKAFNFCITHIRIFLELNWRVRDSRAEAIAGYATPFVEQQPKTVVRHRDESPIATQQPGIKRIFPNRQPGTRRPPTRHDVVIPPRPLSHPLDQVNDKRSRSQHARNFIQPAGTGKRQRTGRLRRPRTNQLCL